jgi:predicted YcjX-like family ATPase
MHRFLQCGLAVGSVDTYLCGKKVKGFRVPLMGDLADLVLRQAERMGDGVSGLFEPTIRLGVTGLSRAGKTVFITSLVANLLDRGRMGAFDPSGRITAAYLQPQPDDTVPRFDYETHLAALTGQKPHWPESTRSVSQLRLSLRIQPSGILSGLAGARTVHLDIVDYPGEWLLDLALMDQSYAQWCESVLRSLASREGTERYLHATQGVDGGEKFEEVAAQKLSKLYTEYLHDARAQGYSNCGPGRFLLPGDLEGAPVISFAPLQRPSKVTRHSLWREMERRYDAYKAQVVKPFFRNHFARIDRQIVLADVLGAIHDGPAAVADMQEAMVSILKAFRPGQNSWLGRLLRGHRVDRILFAATKADHLHHTQHPRLLAITRTMLREAADRAQFQGAEVEAVALASFRATVEEWRDRDGKRLGCVRGNRLDGGGQAVYYPGSLPKDPREIFDLSQDHGSSWLKADYQVMQFAPPVISLAPGDGPPHIRLDYAARFLLGDRL